MNKLRELRETRGLSVRALAAASGVDASTISRIENSGAKAYGQTLRKLADGLKVDVSELEELRDTSASERGRRGGRKSSELREAEPEQQAA